MKPSLVNAAMAAQEAHAARLLELENVIGVGTGLRVKGGKLTNQICVQVLVRRKVPLRQLGARSLVPSALSADGGDIRTDVLDIGLPAAQQDTGRYRPVPAGCSIGPEASVSAGTLGGFACDNTDDTIVLLTNNHVISNLDAQPALRRVVQPGRLDGGVLPGDVIGSLKRDVQVNTVANVPGAPMPPFSVADAAIASVDVDRTDQIRQLNVPAIYEIQAPALNMSVQKRGRTTRLTTNGRVTTINVTQLLGYRNGTRLGRIQNSFIITSTDGNMFSDRGDSGSLILNQARGQLNGTFPVVGLLYGGGTNGLGTPITIANDINAVFGALNLGTICNCIARAIIRAIFQSERAGGAEASGLIRDKERQLRRFREQIERSGRLGHSVADLVNSETARVGHVLFTDDEAFGLLVEALRPLVVQPTNLALSRARVNAEIVAALIAFSARVAKQVPALKSRMALAKTVLTAVKGMTVQQILRAANLSLNR